MKLYSARRHEREISALSEEYDGRLKDLQAALAELKEENRRLSAEISVLRAQKQSISDAMIAASEKTRGNAGRNGSLFRFAKGHGLTGRRKGSEAVGRRPRILSRRGSRLAF